MVKKVKMNKFGYSSQEIKLFKRLSTPKKIQDFLESLPANFEKEGETCRSPRMVLKHKTAHCMEGAMLAAAILEYHGHQPLVIDLRSIKPHDDDHIVAVFKEFGHWGAISKTNHAVLRFREPVYKTIRELVMSYFHEYFMDNGNKTLREYTLPINLQKFNKFNWRTSGKDLFEITDAIDKLKHIFILSRKQQKNLRKADKIEIKAGKLIEWKR